MRYDEDYTNVLSEVYHALSASRRRHAIRLLWQSDNDHLPVRELARKIAAIEEGVSTDCATGEPYRNTYNALSQTHLSTLSDADIVIYDSDRQTVAPGSNFDIAALLIILNRATYQTIQSGSIPNPTDLNITSITD